MLSCFCSSCFCQNLFISSLAFIITMKSTPNCQNKLQSQFQTNTLPNNHMGSTNRAEKQPKRLWLCSLKESSRLVKLFLILPKIMCQLQIRVHHSLLLYTSREPVPTARGLLRSPTPSARIQGLPGAPPPDPWLHPNISVGCALSQH
jgi:hypothetical protein